MLHVLDDELVDVALGLSEIGQVPYVQTVADFATIERGLRLSRQWCRRVIATSPDLAVELAHGLRIPPEGIALIPHGFPAQPEPTPKPAAWTIPVIGAAGPREEISGLLLFAQAARLVVDAGYDVEFVIACHSDLQNMLRPRTKELGIAERMTLTDYPIAGPDFWSVLDIYCQPAVGASTGGMLMLALGRALPCIATNVKGLRNLIESGRDGLLVSPEDPTALQKAITEVARRCRSRTPARPERMRASPESIQPRCRGRPAGGAVPAGLAQPESTLVVSMPVQAVDERD